jgi:PAS domain S-box-containing protein
VTSGIHESHHDHCFRPVRGGHTADRALANALPHVVWTADATGQLEWVNDRWFELTGMTEGDTLNDKGALSAVHPDDLAELTGRWKHALDTSSPTEIEYRIRNADGEYRWHAGPIAPVADAHGNIVRWVAAAFDVTSRHETEQALRRSEAEARARADDLAALMDAVPAAVLITHSRQCREIHGNRAAHEMLRMPMDTNLSKTAIDSTATRHFSVFENGAEVPAEQLPLQRAARGDEFRDHEEEVRFADGHVTHVFGTAVPLRNPDGTPRGAIGAFLDVTHLKNVEEALRLADRRKDEFLALLSHELRNPLAPILTAARLLEFRVDADCRGDLDVIVRQVKHLTRLVDELLDVSRVTRGAVTLSMTRVELADIVAQAAAATSPLFETRGHRLEIDVPVHGLAVDGDQVRLTQVVDNLLSNAARYTLRDGTITVSGRREGDSIVLRVRDNGVGIDPALLPEMFEIFVQGARGNDRAAGGLGVGLALVQRLTELHGGTAEARSDGPGRGSEFVVRLPAAVAPQSHPALPAEAIRATVPTRSPSARARARVLVVDDNRDVADTLSRLLALFGYDVRSALRPTDALAVAVEFRPDIAILDVGLPEMDGHTLGRELRERLSDSPPVLVALSGYNQSQDRRRSEEAGFALHLAKPIDVDALLEAIEKFAPAAASE